jgi:tyrosine-protein kinase Etk/Wzc
MCPIDGALRAALRRSAPRLLLAAIAAGLTTFLLLSLEPARYSAEARLILVLPESQLSSPEIRTRALEAHAHALRDADLIQEAAQGLGADIAGAFRPDLIGWLRQTFSRLSREDDGSFSTRNGPSPRRGAELQEQIIVTPHPQTGSITIAFAAPDPGAAETFVGRLAEAYATRIAQRERQTARAHAIEQLRADIVRDEAKVSALRTVLDSLKNSGEDAALLDQRQEALKSELASAEKVAQQIEMSGFDAAAPRLEGRTRPARVLDTTANATRALADVLRQQVDELARRAAAARERQSELDELTRLVESRRAELMREEEAPQVTEGAASTTAGTLRLDERAKTVRLGPHQRRAPAVLLVMALTLLLGTSAIAAREWLKPGRKLQLASEAAGSSGSAGDGQFADAERFITVPSIDAAATLLLLRSQLQRGFRILVANEAPGGGAAAETAELARLIAEAGRRAVIVCWSLEGSDLPAPGARSQGGLNDLILGTISFEDAIERLDGSSVDRISAGSTVRDKSAALEPDRLNIIFDTLDDAYDIIVVTARHEEARDLFAALEGRFDACLSLAGSEPGSDADGELREAGPGTVLGFEVNDLDIIRCQSADADVAHNDGSAPPASHIA